MPQSPLMPEYDASSAGPTMRPSRLPAPGFGQDSRSRNISPAEADEAPVVSRPSVPATVSADMLRHPLKGKALSMIRKAQSLIEKKAFAQAREELRKAAQDPVAAPYAHSLLGQEYVRNSQFGDAVEE